MPRPTCCRIVAGAPRCAGLTPVGAECCEGEAIILSVDELEAVRLADLERLYQQQAAEAMGVSRQTFGRILEAARAKLAEAIVNGRALRVQGGNVEMGENRVFLCIDCSHEWHVEKCTGRPTGCPSCGSANFKRNDDGGCCAGGKGHKHGHSHGPGQCCGTIRVEVVGSAQE